MAELPVNNTENKSQDDLSAEEISDVTSFNALDILNEELGDFAKAVLGASDDENCSYSKGYVKRQAVYACVTCIPLTAESKPAGICLACTYHCHDGHDLIEMYTKRNFRCDCGNAKFKIPCNLETDKSPENNLNSYNHNFYGLYCTCNRPYPDPEVEIEDDMIQCCICEDWIHGRHLGSLIPHDDEYSDMICNDCMRKHKFLWSYASLMSTGTQQEESETLEETFSTEEAENDIVVKAEKSSEQEIKTPTNEDNDRKTLSEPSSKRIKLEDCKIRESSSVPKNGAVFFLEGWRKQLCNCESCQNMYSSSGLTFLTDEEDTIAAYEEKGKANIEDFEKKDLTEDWSSLSRTRQIEIIREYNAAMKELREYLKKAAEHKKVIQKEDIMDFVSKMKNRQGHKDDAI